MAIPSTGWRRLIGSPKLQIIFHKRATRYRALLRKMTCRDKGSYESSPPCTANITRCKYIYILKDLYPCFYSKCVHIHTHTNTHPHTHTHTHTYMKIMIDTWITYTIRHPLVIPNHIKYVYVFLYQIHMEFISSTHNISCRRSLWLVLIVCVLLCC